MECWWHAARATLAALAMLLGACCLPGEYCGDLEISIVNETAEAVVVFGVGEDGEEVQVIDLLPGQGLPVRDILDQASEVVGSHEDRLCNGDTWEISGRP